MVDRLFACDWGTTRLRAWVLDEHGRALRGEKLEIGVGHLAPGEAAARFEKEVRPRLQAEGLPAVLCGMVGSELGWRYTAYLNCPSSLEDLRAGLQPVAPNVWIVPGLTCPGLAGGPDVMRGEETQVFGWLVLRPERRVGRRLICHPGTHTKWIDVEDGVIARFATAMTGEFFDLLRRHSVLRTAEEPEDPVAFVEGVEVGRSGLLLSAAAFTARARRATGELSRGAVASYLSGVLIGAEVAAMPGLIDPAPDEVVVLGARSLAERYVRALQAVGLRAEAHDGEAAAQAGLFALSEFSSRIATR